MTILAVEPARPSERAAPPRLPESAAWADALIGVPHVRMGRDPAAGWDCWGLVEWVMSSVYGWTIPDLMAEIARDPGYRTAAAGRLRRHERCDAYARMIAWGLPAWREVAPGPGAVALFRIAGRPIHVGVLIGAGDFLHVLADTGTTLESLRSALWSRRFVGAYVPREQ